MRRTTWLCVALGGLGWLMPACDGGTDDSSTRDESVRTEESDADDDAEEDADDDADSASDAAKPPKDEKDAGKVPKPMMDARVGSGDGGARADAGQQDAGGPSTDAGVGSAMDASEPPPTGSFPSVDDVGENGPYTAKTVTNTGPNGGYTVYHPTELSPGGLLHPIVSWGNGGATTPVDYPMLPHLATHGFVVVASNNPLVGGADVRAGIDWLVAQNDDSDSPFHQKLDVDNISGVGYSLGGLATYEIAADPRVVTIVIISGGQMNDDSRSMSLPKLHTPIAYFCTDDDASEGNCAGDFAMVQVPSFFGVMNGSAHTDVTEFLGLGVPEIIAQMHRATTAWLRWHQMGDEAQKPLFVGDDCGLCTDSKWTVQPQKNLE